MLKRAALAITLTLIPLFTAVTSVNAATYYSIFDIFRFLSIRKPTPPTYSPFPTISPAITQPAFLTPTATPTNTPTLTPTSSPTPTLTPTTTPTVTLTNTPTPTPSPTNSMSPTPITTPINTSETIKNYIMNEINLYRKSQGLYEVKTNEDTCDFAAIRAKEISLNFNHSGFTNRINSQTLPYSSYSKITENIAMNSNYQKVVTQWKNSTGHAANMRADTPFVCVEKYGNYYAYEGLRY